MPGPSATTGGSRARRAAWGVLVACSLFALAEGAARLSFGEPTPPLVAELPEGAGAWFTEGEGTLTPTWQARDVIDPVPVAHSAPRVVWLGGSSVHGGNPDVPPAGEAAGLVGSWLGVESLNLGGPGMDSALIGAMLPDALRLTPDVVVFYAGHNDLGNAVFTNRYGDARTLWSARVRALFGFSRLFELAESALRAREVVRVPRPGQEGSFRVDAARRRVIHWRYEERLREMVRRTRATGAEFVLATVMSNPLAPYLEPSCPEQVAALGLRVNQRPEAVAVDRVEPEALEAARAAAPDCPDLRWIAARQAADRGDPDALEELDRLRDEDPLPLRADRTMLAIIRRVAREEGALLADVNAAVREQGGGVEPAAYFLDFVHPTAAGQRAIAAVTAPVVAGALGLPAPETALPQVERRPYAACHTRACLGRPPGGGPPGPGGGLPGRGGPGGRRPPEARPRPEGGAPPR